MSEFPIGTPEFAITPEAMRKQLERCMPKEPGFVLPVPLQARHEKLAYLSAGYQMQALLGEPRFLVDENELHELRQMCFDHPGEAIGMIRTSMEELFSAIDEAHHGASHPTYLKTRSGKYSPYDDYRKRIIASIRKVPGAPQLPDEQKLFCWGVSVTLMCDPFTTNEKNSPAFDIVREFVDATPQSQQTSDAIRRHKLS